MALVGPTSVASLASNMEESGWVVKDIVSP